MANCGFLSLLHFGRMAAMSNTSQPTFDDWFNENYEEISKMLENDTRELLYTCWLAGYETGMTRAIDLLRPSGEYH
jgi:hypothetical protein